MSRSLKIGNQTYTITTAGEVVNSEGRTAILRAKHGKFRTSTGVDQTICMNQSAIILYLVRQYEFEYHTYCNNMFKVLGPHKCTLLDNTYGGYNQYIGNWDDIRIYWLINPETDETIKSTHFGHENDIKCTKKKSFMEKMFHVKN